MTFFLKKARSNANYIIINSSILLELVNSKLQLNIPNYQLFVDDALNEILPQIQNNNIIVFNHKIPLQFKNQLILNLFLLSNPKRLEFLPFILSQFLFSNIEYLIQNLSKTDLFQILPQNDQLNCEIIEFITKDDRTELISKMSNNSISQLISCAIFIQTKGQFEVNNLTKETILPFLAISLIILQANHLEEIQFLKLNLSNLFLEGTTYAIEKKMPILNASIDYILENRKLIIDTNIIDIRTYCKVVKNLILNNYGSNIPYILRTYYEYKSESQDLYYIKINDIFEYVLDNYAEFKKYSQQLDISKIDTKFLKQKINNLNTH